MVRVLDFGIAKLTAREGDAAASTALTNTGAMLGTPFYMAPEQVFGERDLDHRADVWALGVIAYECLSGRRPFEGENFGQVFKAVTRGQLVPLRSIAADLPSDVLDVVDRMLTTDRDRRADLHAVLAVFERHTDRRVDTFAAPTLPIDALPDDAFAPTIAAATPALEGQTPGVLMRSAPPPSVSSTPRAADAGLKIFPSRRLFTFRQQPRPWWLRWRSLLVLRRRAAGSDRRGERDECDFRVHPPPAVREPRGEP